MFRECSMVEWLGGGVGCLNLQGDLKQRELKRRLSYAKNLHTCVR